MFSTFFSTHIWRVIPKVFEKFAKECLSYFFLPSSYRILVIGRKLKLRHFRDGKELPWIANDDNYDFNYQQNHPLANPVKVLPGDQMTIGELQNTKYFCSVKLIKGNPRI